MTDPTQIEAPVSAWLVALDGEACGPDLEYDADFLELELAAAGKPETSFAPAEPPNWGDVSQRAAALMERTRDLRVAVLWTRSQVYLLGLPGLLAGLQLLGGLLETFWEQGLHPRLDPDDGDPFSRLNVLGALDKLEGLLGDVRQSPVLNDRRLGGLRVRDIEVALERLPPRADESPRSAGELRAMFEDLHEARGQLRSVCEAALGALKSLHRQLVDRVGSADAVDVKALRQMIEAVAAVLPPEPDAAAEAPAEGTPASDAEATPAVVVRASAGPGTIASRRDAIRAIGLVREYLEKNEPTNPAQLLLRRAERLIEGNFLQVVRELAPDAVAEVARVLGVDPDSIEDLA